MMTQKQANKQTNKQKRLPPHWRVHQRFFLLHLFLCLNSTLSSKDAYWRRHSLTGHKSFRSQQAMMDLRRFGGKKEAKKKKKRTLRNPAALQGRQLLQKISLSLPLGGVE